MIDKKTLIEQMSKLGIKEGDTLLVHSSMKAIGAVEGGADTVLDALTETVCGQIRQEREVECAEGNAVENGNGDTERMDGMLVLPTHTWKTMNNEHYIYNSQTEPACVGILPNLFMKREGVLRSNHPTHSVAAFCWNQRKMKAYISGEERFSTPCDRRGCYGKLYDLDAKILLLGVGLNRNTYMHGVEEWFGITERLTNETLSLYIQDKKQDGKEVIYPVCMHKHFKPNNISISENYMRMKTTFLKENALIEGEIGDACCMLMSARKVADLTTEALKKNRDFFL